MNDSWLDEEDIKDPHPVKTENKWTHLLKKIEPFKTEVLLGVFGLVLALFIINPWSSKYVERQIPKEVRSSLGTMIPKGFQVVPIDLTNTPAIQSLVGSHGYVDIYGKSPSYKKGPYELVVSSVRLIQAPLDPNQYAVLCPEQLASHILKYQGPFKVVVNGSSHQKNYEIKKKVKKKSRITIGESDP